jgi:hypothetical protein
MLNILTPKVVRNIADQYKDLLGFGSYGMLCAYILCYLYGLENFSDLVRTTPWTMSLSSISRQMNAINPQNLNRAMRRLRASVLKKVGKNPDDWVFAFDTTANPKRVEKLIGGGHWADSRGCVFEGRTILVVVAINIKTGTTIPVAYAPCIKTKDDPENGKTAWKLLLELVDKLLEEGFPRLPLVGDSWFDGVEFFEELNSRGLKFSIELKSSRTATDSSQLNAKWDQLVLHFREESKKQVIIGTNESKDSDSERRYVASKMLTIKTGKSNDKNKKTILVSVTAVYNNPADKTPFAYYATNDFSKSASWQWRMSRLRWNIEVLFRDLKQNLNWGKSDSKTQNGCDIEIVFPLLIIAYLRINIDHENNMSIGLIINQIKQQELIRNLDYIVKHNNSALFLKYKERMHPSRACRKPLDRVAEGNMESDIFIAS